MCCMYRGKAGCENRAQGNCTSPNSSTLLGPGCEGRGYPWVLQYVPSSLLTKTLRIFPGNFQRSGWEEARRETPDRKNCQENSSEGRTKKKGERPRPKHREAGKAAEIEQELHLEVSQKEGRLEGWEQTTRKHPSRGDTLPRNSATHLPTTFIPYILVGCDRKGISHWLEVYIKRSTGLLSAHRPLNT